MGTEILVDHLYDEGKKLIESLDDAGLKCPIALLAHFPDESDWEVLLGIPGIDLNGKRKILLQIFNIIQNKKIDLDSNNLRVVDTKSEVCQDIKSRMKTGMAIGKIPFINKYINSRPFPDSIIYRVN